MRYQISYSCISHIGKIRGMNQDNLICGKTYMERSGAGLRFPLRGAHETKKTLVLGVFDGMGGEECGEVAAYLAAKEAASLRVGRKPAAKLLKYCRKANLKICGYAKKHAVRRMGTTAAMLAFSKKGITLCNIGDSKIYRLSGGALEQLSQDHVLPAPPGKKPPLAQCLGIPPEEMYIEPYTAPLEYRAGDVYLLCSDGLTDMVTEEEITEILSASADPATELVQRALEHGGRDNVTVIFVRICKK